VEGAPAHPAYGAGHATVAGACVTVLKAWFDESEVFDETVVPPTMFIPEVPEVSLTAAEKALIRVQIREKLRENRRPKEVNLLGNLVDYAAPATEPKLTVGGELNKLASNIALARNAAGVHWRSDYTESIKLGEEIAIRLLQEQKLTYNEDHHFSLTKFDGTKIVI